MSAALEKAEQQDFAEPAQLKSFNNLIIRACGVIAENVTGTHDQGASGELSPQLRHDILVSIAEPYVTMLQEKMTQGQGADYSNLASLERTLRYLDTLLEVLTPAPKQGAISAADYDLLNRMVGVKLILAQQVASLKQQQESAKVQDTNLMERAAVWSETARQALQRFDNIRPVVKFGSDQDTVVHRNMIAAHVATSLQEVAEFVDEMRHFVAEATPLLAQLGHRPLSEDGLTAQRAQLRELATVAGRLTRLEQEWVR